MSERHTVHLRDGGKVIIDGNRVEVHVDKPFVFRRQSWVRYLTPREEASRTMLCVDLGIGKMLEEAFSAVPMVVAREDD